MKEFQQLKQDLWKVRAEQSLWGGRFGVLGADFWLQSPQQPLEHRQQRNPSPGILPLSSALGNFTN